jgi:hypothetical protein
MDAFVSLFKTNSTPRFMNTIKSLTDSSYNKHVNTDFCKTRNYIISDICGTVSDAKPIISSYLLLEAFDSKIWGEEYKLLTIEKYTVYFRYDEVGLLNQFDNLSIYLNPINDTTYLCGFLFFLIKNRKKKTQKAGTTNLSHLDHANRIYFKDCFNSLHEYVNYKLRNTENLT